jgi:phenylalanyl-tRNA synthetase beta chain
MKVPISWLREYVDFDLSARALAEKLTFSGTEVAGVETVGQDYAHVRVAEVLAVEPHPRADRLRLCRVGVGDGERRVVCGASNFTVGDRVVLAEPGAALPNGMKIAPAILRGERSEGMLCAEDELGLSRDHSGIMVLDRTLAAGTPLADVVGGPETVLNLEITWNRSDCLSVLGIAREIAALLRLPPRIPDPVVAESDEPVERLAAVEIADPEGCPRYTARVLRGVKLGPSPRWMQRRLELCGMRPINNIVDITNYVMLETGHPLHAFDYELVGGHRIVVRRARAGEAMATLDGVSRPLDVETLVIADADRPVAIAGIMGGAGSEIGGATSTVLLEGATFDPRRIHRTSVRLGLSTESAHRYERGVCAGRVEWVSRRAAELMTRLAGATAAKGVMDRYPGRAPEKRVSCRFARVRQLIGVPIPDDEVVSILSALQLEVVSRDVAGCVVRAPDFRSDIEIEADLVEEVARIHGLSEIPAATPRTRVVDGVSDAPERAVAACRASLAGLGLTEIMNYSFLASGLLDAFDPASADSRVVLPNPVSADHGVLRNVLTPQMVETLGRNLARETEDAAFFEMGRVFARAGEGRIVEETRIAVGLMGRAGRGGMDRVRPVREQEMFLWVKGVVEALGEATHAGPLEFRPAAAPWLDPDWSMDVRVDARVVGRLGLLRAEVRKAWRMLQPVGVAELEAAPFLARLFEKRSLKAMPAYPSVARDVAMIVDERITHAETERAIRDAAPAELEDVRLFDVFRNAALGAGRKSVAYRLRFRSGERTLTDEEANAYHAAVKEALRERLQAELREG